MTRAVSLSNYLEVARFVGLDPDAMLTEVGLDPAQLADHDVRVSAHAVVRLFAESARRSGCPTFGLLMAECRTFASLGPASLLMKHQPSLRSMIEAAIRFQRHFSDVVNMRLDDDEETAILRWDFTPEFTEPQWVEYSVATGYRALTEAMGGRWQPESMHFTHLAPDASDAYRRFFQCRTDFDAEFNGLSCPSSALDLPNTGASSTMAAHAERLLGMVPAGQPDGSIVERARHALYLLIHGGDTTLARVADTLGMHPRAFQRQLDKEGLSFAALLNETRRELARHYLSGQHHSIATISRLSGYSNQSAFTRWFTGEFGQSPATWRAGIRHG